jgi:UDP-N-acetylmuramoylalanine--D-glutamate ligase
MTPLAQFHGKKVGVFGLGKAGMATVAGLIAGGAEAYVFDDNAASVTAAQQKFGERIHLQTPELWPWDTLTCMVLSPGIPLTHPRPHAAVALANNARVPVVGDVELLYQACPDACYVGITGTNGKSTTTTLIAHVLKHAGLRVEVGGNLGTPALALAPLSEGEVYVLELSSYQLDLVHSTHMDVAVLLNLTPDHLDRHGDMEGYLAAKMRLFDRQETGDVAIVAVDDDYTRRAQSELRTGGRRVLPVSAYGEAEIYARDGVVYSASGTIDLKPIRSLQGQHNWQNAVAAYAVAQTLGVPHAAIAEAMQSFPGLAHRMEWIADMGNVRFINDSKATNAEATVHALRAFQNIYWVLGGKAKEGGIESLASYFPFIRHAYLIGDASDAFAKTLEGKVGYTRCGTLDRAVAEAARDASVHAQGGVVLLSPACASFDQFKNFEERGDTFRALVENWKASHAA